LIRREGKERRKGEKERREGKERRTEVWRVFLIEHQVTIN
jgi:hypothetical protein